MEKRKTAIVIGSGAGGAVMAKELQKRYDVTILERGKDFRALRYPLDKLAALRRTGLFLDERMISMLLPNLCIRKSEEMVIAYGKGIGGTTTMAAGNAVRYDMPLKKIGIDLDKEFAELYDELPITTGHRSIWNRQTQKMYDAFEKLGLEPYVTPKFMYEGKCVQCGRCAVGCPTGAKWDTRALVESAVRDGAVLVTGCEVKDIETDGSRAVAVNARCGTGKKRFTADLIVLCAGGMETPNILRNSGIDCEDTFFVDPVLCVAGPLDGIRQDRQMLMPFISQQDGYILSPYIDCLSFFFNKEWDMPLDGIASIMIKLADDEGGFVRGRKVSKVLTEKDRKTLERAVDKCRQILKELGVPEEKQVIGTLIAAHPGGMLPLTEAESESLHSKVLPENMYVCDASLLPGEMGNPPILTILALAKKMAKIIKV